VPIKLEEPSVIVPEPVDNMSCDIQPCKSLDDAAPELRKVPNSDGCWQEPIKPAFTPTDHGFNDPVVKKEFKEFNAQPACEQLPMMSLIKAEENAEGRSTPSAQWSDVKSVPMSRAVASVALCPSRSPIPCKSLAPPPLLLHSTAVPLLPMECQTPSTVAAQNAEASCDANQMMFEERSDDSDMDTGTRSPSPELRPINEQFRSSKNAV